MASNNLSYDAQGRIAYAGFWWRIVAFLIDGAVLYVASIVANLALGIFFELLGWVNEMLLGDDTVARILSGIVGLGLFFLPSILYSAIMESSEKQATLGKMAVGIKVASLNGERISFKVAVIRYFAKYLSELTLGIGYLVMLFTKRKQALHDLLAKTIVVEKAWSKPEIPEQSSLLTPLSQEP